MLRDRPLARRRPHRLPVLARRRQFATLAQIIRANLDAKMAVFHRWTPTLTLPRLRGRGGWGEKLTDFGEQLARAEGFGDIAVAAGFPRLRLVAGERVGSHGDDRHLR